MRIQVDNDLFSAKRELEKGEPTSTMPPRSVQPPPSAIWKIATADDAAAWTQSGSLGQGSELDRTDGFIHASDGVMVRTVASMFFKGRADVVLLHITLPGRVDVEPAERGAPPPAALGSAAEGEAPHYVVQQLADGCQHIWFSRPIPWSAVEQHPLPLGPSGEHVFPAECHAETAAADGAVQLAG